MNQNTKFSREQLAPYWISPEMLEPENITYMVSLSLEYAPIEYQETQIHAEYPSKQQILDYIEVDLESMEIDYEEYFGWANLKSTKVFNSFSDAENHANSLWSQSTIEQQFLDGKLHNAICVVKEVENGFPVYLYDLTGREKPHMSRKDYLTREALGETLAYALDIQGYRELYDLPYESFGNQRLLYKLHHRRAHSTHVPESTRLESQMWLEENPLKKIPDRKKAAIYARTTSTNNHSLSYQEEDCRKYCQENDYVIVDSLVVKEVASPSTLHREGLEKIIQAVLDHEFDVLVTWEFPVLTRDPKHAEYLDKIFTDNHVNWVWLH